MIRALSVQAEQDLQTFSEYLWQLGIVHRISERGDKQVVWVRDEQDAAAVSSLYERFSAGQLGRLHSLQPEEPRRVRNKPHWATPVSAATLGSSPCMALLVIFSIFITILLYSPFGLSVFNILKMETLDIVVGQAQVWRLVTPVFLHFGFMHLAFNLVLLWFFGRQLEARVSTRRLILLLLVFAVVPNVAQYLTSGGQFGGMSGVVYAIVAYCWLRNRLDPGAGFVFPPALMGLMVIWLLVGFSQLLTYLGFPKMANVAHLMGLVSGLAAAWVPTVLKN